MHLSLGHQQSQDLKRKLFILLLPLYSNYNNVLILGSDIHIYMYLKHYVWWCSRFTRHQVISSHSIDNVEYWRSFCYLWNIHSFNVGGGDIKVQVYTYSFFVKKTHYVCWCPRPICHQGPLLLTWLIFNPAWISNHLPGKGWDEITYPSINCNGCTVEAWELIGNFIPHFIMDVIDYPCWDWI